MVDTPALYLVVVVDDIATAVVVDVVDVVDVVVDDMPGVDTVAVVVDVVVAVEAADLLVDEKNDNQSADN